MEDGEIDIDEREELESEDGEHYTQGRELDLEDEEPNTEEGRS